MDKSPQKAIKAQCLWGEKDYSVAKAQEKKKKAIGVKECVFCFLTQAQTLV